MEQFIRRQYFDPLVRNLQSQPNLLQIIIGPRQVGKTTLARQIKDQWKGLSHYATADMPGVPGRDWIEEQWGKARSEHQTKPHVPYLLILDEVQKVQNWSSAVKQLFDEDRIEERHLRVLLLGSSALLMQRGLTESLAGRFELHRHAPWSYAECREHFGISFSEYLFFGGYPVGLSLREDEKRWTQYVRDALIETVLSKDLLLMVPIRKPALLRQTFALAALHPAEIVSYQKMTGTLQDAGNATTIASYLQLLSQAFLVHTLERWSGSRIRQRGSQPKIIIPDNGIANAMAGRRQDTWRTDANFRGRMTENAVGAVLHVLAAEHGGTLFYFRERGEEIDFVLQIGNDIMAIEVKSGVQKGIPPSLVAFCRKKPAIRGIVISGQADALSIINEHVSFLTLEEFFLQPEHILTS
jgi:uncharacterized protein